MKALMELKEALSTIGLKRTLVVIWGRFVDALFDWRYGTDTVRRIELGDLHVSAETRNRGQKYQPTGVRPFRHFLRRMQFPRDAVFVDFGCGKGRVLLMAAAYGFRRVVGIEFAPELCEVARANVAAFGRRRAIGPVEIVEGDVCNYLMKGDENIFYYFHPFDAEIMGRTVDSIVASLKANPRHAWLVYYLPRHVEAIDARPEFIRCCEDIIGGYEVIVYEHSPELAGSARAPVG